MKKPLPPEDCLDLSDEGILFHTAPRSAPQRRTVQPLRLLNYREDPVLLKASRKASVSLLSRSILPGSWPGVCGWRCSGSPELPGRPEKGENVIRRLVESTMRLCQSVGRYRMSLGSSCQGSGRQQLLGWWVAPPQRPCTVCAKPIPAVYQRRYGGDLFAGLVCHGYF